MSVDESREKFAEGFAAALEGEGKDAVPGSELEELDPDHEDDLGAGDPQDEQHPDHEDDPGADDPQDGPDPDLQDDPGAEASTEDEFDDGADDYRKWSREKVDRSYNSSRKSEAAAQRRVNKLEKGRRPEPEPVSAENPFEIPEDLKPDLEELSRLSPDLAKIALEDSVDGNLVRRGLEEFGPAQTAMSGRGIVAERMVSAGEVRNSQAFRDAHDRAIFEAHPDVLFESEAELSAFQEKLEAWTGAMPYAEAQEINTTMGLYDQRGWGQGSPAQVIAVLDQFKRDTGDAPPKTPKPSKQTQRDAEALEDPQRKASAPPKDQPDKGDFSGGFRDAVRRHAKGR